MKTSALFAALFAVTCLSLGAQVDAKKKQAKTETVYLVDISGISG